MVVGGKTYGGLNSYFLEMYGGTIDKFMCTGLCPCNAAAKPLYAAITDNTSPKKGFMFTKSKSGGGGLFSFGTETKKYRVADFAKMSTAEQTALGALN